MGKIKKSKDLIGLTDCPHTVTDLITMHESQLEYFSKLRESALENERYLRAQNISSEVEKQIYSQGRIPFPIGIMADKLNKFIASERSNRTSFRLIAKRADAEIKCALGNLRMKDVEGNSHGEYVETDVTTAGIAVKFGVAKIELYKDKNLDTCVRYRSIDYQKFIFDSNARTFEKNDAAFMGECIPTYRKDIRKDYGDKIADGIEIGEDYSFGRPIRQYWGTTDQKGRKDLDIINLYEHYEKIFRTYYYAFHDKDLVYRGTDKKTAEETVRKFHIPYLVLGLPLPKVEVIEMEEPGIDKYVFTYNCILEYEKTDYDYYPYSIYQSFQFENEIWCMADMLKSPAKFADKLISQIDYAFGADIKNGWEIVEPWLAMGIDMNEAIRRVKAGEPVPVIHAGAIKSIASKGANPQWMSMLELMTTLIGEMSGGVWGGEQPPGKQREAQGTVQMKMLQGSLPMQLFMDNKKRFKADLGRKIMWFLKNYDTKEHILRVHGPEIKKPMLDLLQKQGMYEPSPVEKSVGYVTVNKDGVLDSYLDNMEYDLEISQSELSETQKQQRLSELNFAKQAGLVIPPSVWLEFLDLDYSLKMEIIEANQEAAQQSQQDREDQKNLEILKATKGETKAGEEVGNIVANDAIQQKQAQIQQQRQQQPVGA